jgi:hypothetical protein
VTASRTVSVLPVVVGGGCFLCSGWSERVVLLSHAGVGVLRLGDYNGKALR